MSDNAYEAIIGLEVHTHLMTRSKLFCGCSAGFGAGPNENVCPVCMGMPGVLPVLNRHAVELAIRAGLAAHCEIAPESIFDRKSYFYPDLPKGYQISQYELPLCKGGYIELPAQSEGAEARRIRLTRIHMEEDAGKNIHESGASLVDFNRSGVPLVEIVSEPDIRSAEEAGAYLRELRSILRYIEASDGKMEEGGLRCDVNVSVRKRGASEFGVKTEIKNLNSFRFVEKAIEHEVARQIDLLESGGRVAQETHLWDPVREVTRPMRSKEFANDYRYFPEPDLPPLRVTPDVVEAIKTAMPELPADTRARFIRDLGLTAYEAGVLTQDLIILKEFEGLCYLNADPKAAASWVINEVRRWSNELPRLLSFLAQPVSGRIFMAYERGELSYNAAKTVFAELVRKVIETPKPSFDGPTGGPVGQFINLPPAQIKKLFNEWFDQRFNEYAQVSDEAAIGAACDRVIAAETAKVAEYRGGRDKLFGFFVGQVMKAMGGKGNPKVVNEILKRKLTA